MKKIKWLVMVLIVVIIFIILYLLGIKKYSYIDGNSGGISCNFSLNIYTKRLTIKRQTVVVNENKTYSKKLSNDEYKRIKNNWGKREKMEILCYSSSYNNE